MLLIFAVMVATFLVSLAAIPDLPLDTPRHAACGIAGVSLEQCVRTFVLQGIL